MKFFATLFLFFFVCSLRSVKAGESPRWHPYLTRACEVARQEQKPIFLVFRCVR